MAASPLTSPLFHLLLPLSRCLFHPQPRRLPAKTDQQQLVSFILTQLQQKQLDDPVSSWTNQMTPSQQHSTRRQPTTRPTPPSPSSSLPPPPRRYSFSFTGELHATPLQPTAATPETKQQQPRSSNFTTSAAARDEENTDTQQNFVERKHQFPEMELLIQEFSFHQMNANLLWPGTFAFAEWLAQHTSWLRGRCIIELGSGTGALAIFLRKSFQLDITTSDYDDPDIEENIAHNCRANGVSPVLPHIRHSWGDVFPVADPDWDLIIASDILLYVKQYENLVKTLCFLLKSYKPKVNETGSGTSEEKDICTLPRPAFLMSWRRRIGKEEESLFFTGCKKAGLEVNHLGSRVYCIQPKKSSAIGAV